MADIKITDLVAYSDPVSTDVLPIVDVGADITKKVSIADLMENAGAGSVGAPSIAFDGDIDTGFYHPALDTVALVTAGVERIRVDSSGNIGFFTPTPAASFDIGSTDAVKLPVGTAAQRPGTPAAGMFRFNNDSSEFEGYNGTEWGAVGAPDVGTDPQQIPLNQFLGKQAFVDEVGTIRPNASAPQQNLDIIFEYVSDTSINVKMRGADGTVRSTTLTLS